MSITIAVVDDHPMVVGGLNTALSTVADFEVVGSGATLAEARAFLTDQKVHVLLLDVRLEDGNGLVALSEHKPGTGPAVIVMSSFATSQYVAAARRFGAAGYLLKTVPLAELVSAIRRVALGEAVFTVEQASHQFVDLTTPERRVLKLAMDGLSNKEIGQIVGTSRKGVEAHLSDLYARHGVRGGRVELLIRAEREGWLEIDAHEPNGAGPRRARRPHKGADIDEHQKH